MLNKNYFLDGVVLSLVYEILYFVCLLNIYKNIVVTLLLWLLLLSVIPFFGYIFERSCFNKKLRSGALFGTLPAAAVSIIIIVYRTKALKHFDITPLLYLLPSFLGVIAVSVLAIYLKKSQVNLRTPIMLSAAYSFLITVPTYVCCHISAIMKNSTLSGINYILLIAVTVIFYLIFRYLSYKVYAEKTFFLSLLAFIVAYCIPSCVLFALSSIEADSMMLLYIFYYPPILVFILIIDSIVLLTQKSLKNSI